MGVPVDRGWAWVIVFGAFFNLFIFIGIAKSLGILFMELIIHFDGLATSAAMLFSLLGGAGLFTAPLVTALAEIFGFRLICMCGAVLACIGVLISSFGQSLSAVILPYGIIAGLGIGMTLIPAPVIVAKYFDKKRALANGLVFTGSGLGGIVFPYFMYYITKEYTLNQALMILSGVCLNCVLGAALYRPISFYNNSTRAVVRTVQVPEEKLLEPKKIEIESGDLDNLAESFESLDYLECKTAVALSQESVYFSALNLATLSFQDIPAELERPGVPGVGVGVEWSTRKFLSRLCSVKNAEGDQTPILDLHLFRKPEFSFFAVGCFLGVAGMYIGMVTPAHCTEHLAVSKSQVAVLLSVMGASDTAGRLFVGFVSDLGFAKSRRVQFLSFYLLVSSVSCSASVFLATNFSGQVVFLLVHPFCCGAFIALTPVVLSDIVGIGRMAGGWGIVLFVQGLSHVASPLLIGAIRDTIGSYVIVYFVISALLFVGGSSIAMIAIFRPILQIFAPQKQ